MDKYTEKMIAEMKAENKSQAIIDAETIKMKSFNEMYQNPFFNALLSYAEIVPVGLLVSLICALILKRKPEPAVVGTV